MQKEADMDQLHKFIQICQRHRLKITPQRVAIYQNLLGMNTHPTADAVYQILRKEYPHISFDTVNRTLLTFTEIGVLDVVEIFSGAKRFDTDLTPHHHLHCLKCGNVYGFHSETYDNLTVPKGIQQQFQVVSKRVILKGFCRKCQNENPQKRSETAESRGG
jgi:Fur family transcriptional regulator, peroxide stress response regulator